MTSAGAPFSVRKIACPGLFGALVSNYRDRPYRGGRQRHWIKVKKIEASRLCAGEIGRLKEISRANNWCVVVHLPSAKTAAVILETKWYGQRTWDNIAERQQLFLQFLLCACHTVVA